ncbi:MAG: type II toxin-antitoxin system VapC family toxin [Bifidobacteriaceae bacterium]|jgi:PIN domain nuclease of toxin-antitoxin system|nr:type II toxin-antitoxin system VapC family toxin [Bifidobacteriaceae bacterium]
MRLLLDTHALLWAVRKPDGLSATAAALIADTDNSLAVSPVAAWELGIKARLGKLPEALPLLADYSAAMARLGAAPTPITDADALLASDLPWGHRDPFDRMLAAQALNRGLALVSKDMAFDQVRGIVRLW